MYNRGKILTMIIVLVMLMQSLNVLGDTDASIKVSIDGRILSLTEDAFVTDGRVLVPLRGVFESLGIHVDYNQTTGQVIAKSDDVEVLMTIGEDVVLVNGQATSLDVGTIAFDGRTYVPIRFIAEAFGHGVDWDGPNRTVLIETDAGETFDSKALPLLEDRETLLALMAYNDTMSGYLFEPVMWMMEDMEIDFLEEAPAATNDSDVGSTGDDAKEFSDTNNQVVGVQESDVLKTDGNYIYQVVDGNVRIVNTDPGNLMQVGSISDGDNYIEEIFLSDNRLVTYSRSYSSYIEPMPLMETGVAESMIWMPYYEDETFVNVYDVTRPSQPVKEQAYKFDGNYVSGRLIGDDLYMSTSRYFWIDPYMTDDEMARISDGQILPSYTNLMTGETTTLAYEDIRYFPDQISSQYFMTIGLALDTGQMDVDAYLGYSGQVYVSQEGFYTAVTHYEYNILESDGYFYQPIYDPNTVIYRFAIGDGAFEYDTKGMVEGTVLNQFSMDEYDGNFRIATTQQGSWWWGSQDSSNNLYILDNDLNQIGSIENIAEGESIYSTRFVGDKIYMVTYRQVDPFFVIDASDPKNPEILGFLKIPGFSNYMHPMDEHHILGFGQETYENEFGWTVTGGFKISLFDVTNFENPIESDQIIIGKAGTYSEIQNNHKALMYAMEKGIMALPISVSDYQEYTPDFIGAYVFDISTEDISIRGRVAQDYGEYGSYYDWTYAIDRIIYIDDQLFAFSDGAISVYNQYTLDEITRLIFE